MKPARIFNARWLLTFALVCTTACDDTEKNVTAGSSGNAGHSGTSAAGSAGSAGTSGSSNAGQAGNAGVAPESICDVDAAQEMAFATVKETKSCALSCSSNCDLPNNPWACPAMDDYFQLPHDCSDNMCGHWDGQYPTVQKGRCSASVPSGQALAKTTAFGSTIILPDGRRLDPAGKEFLFPNKYDDEGADDDDLVGTFPYSAIWVEGTRFIVVSDAGVNDHVLRVLDSEKLAQGEDPIVGEIPFGWTLSLNYGLAVTSDGTVLAASGAPDSIIRAYSIDSVTGAITENPEKNILVSDNTDADVFPQGIAVSPDGKKLVVGQVKRSNLLVYGLEPANYGQKLAKIDLGNAASDHFSVLFRPLSNDEVFVSLWLNTKVARVNLSTQEVTTFDVGKQPEEMVFLDSEHLAVTASLGDDISIINLASATVSSTWADATTQLHGSGPTALAYDASSGRLYTTLSGRNSVAVHHVSDDNGEPSLTAEGVIPTGWWPTDVLIAGPSDPGAGSIVAITGKGHGTGTTYITDMLYGTNVSAERMRGSIQYVPALQSSDIADYTDRWTTANQLAGIQGAPDVSCDAGVEYDFPVPRTNTEGPSKYIKHIVFIVRENKTFDAVFGDMPNVDGDSELVMAPGRMDLIWPNIRSMAKQFSHGDNFYEDAEQSIQGHFWTSFGRMSDFTERTWLTTWGRGTRGPVPQQGTISATQPVEGGIFGWLQNNQVDFDNMGELLGSVGLDGHYGLGGLVSTSSKEPDTSLACYMAARARVLCDLKTFTYAWYPNDHTHGAEPGLPNPGIFIAVSDEATGMFVDALSHSPQWKDSLVVIVEDDPQDGGDHVDNHRSLVVMASPWVKRGYVSHTHFDIASVHKLFAHLLGLPYNNVQAQDAIIPYDIFTSTPDYTPFTYQPLLFDDLSCNPDNTKMAQQAKRWDFTMPDEQPGLGKQVYFMLHYPGLEMPDDDD